MPNTRRRRFSVKNDIDGRHASKLQNGTSDCQTEPEDPKTKSMTQNLVAIRSSKSRNKTYSNGYKNSSSSEIVAESSSSLSIVRKRSATTVDKNVTASSSNIDLFNILNSTNNNFSIYNGEGNSMKDHVRKDVLQDKTAAKRDKLPRQHRAKIRSPKRRISNPENQCKSVSITKCTIGTTTNDWRQEFEINNILNETDPIQNIATITEAIEFPDPAEDERNINEESRISTHSIEDMCRICHGGEALSSELGQLISACSCRGTVGRVHVKCLERWLTESGKSRCELCGTQYATKRVHRYGVPRALVMWILSQNAKQLMVDSLGIMLMSPLAVLAAWLSGRTLAGLMTQDSHVTPWPLASTFVLACMTLVCYYCWIVSAATRHALGWWIWYRSQYEVRLQIQNNDD